MKRHVIQAPKKPAAAAVAALPLRQKALAIARDWRVRTLVPVIVVNLAVFAGLYALMYHFALSNLVQTRRDGAALLFSELRLHISDSMADHSDPKFRTRLEREAAAHQLYALNVYDTAGNPTLIASAAPGAREQKMARAVLAGHGSPAPWLLRDDNVVVFARSIPNEPACHRCHDPRIANLGVMQIAFDLNDKVADAHVRVRQKFVVAGVAWLAILAILVWTARHVIGRPLARIERSLTASGSPDRARSRDLEALANRVNETIWRLLDNERRRQETIAAHLVRAEQLSALGELAAGLTHEIKNPLAAVIAVLEVIDGVDDAQEREELSAQMLAELRRVTATLDSLLRLAKPQPPQRERLDLRSIASEVSLLFGKRMQRLGIALRADCAESLPAIPLDRSLITQVVVNLLTNAMQASDRGGTVTILLAPFPHRDGVVLVVSDEGRGIPAEQLAHVFDPFFTTKEEGTGLGLPICRQIVEQHGGTMTIESEPGKGTRVIVLIPDADAAADQEPFCGAFAAG